MPRLARIPLIRSRRSILLGAALALAALLTALLATPATEAGATSSSGLVQIASDVLPGLGLLAPGAAPPSAVLHVGLALASPRSDAEASYEEAIYDPSGPLYHHFLTPAQFASEFGVPRSAYQAVLGWLSSGGLRVTFTDASGTWVQATGTVSQIERLMHITIASFDSKGVSFLANETGPVVPSGDSIYDVLGLNTLQHETVPQEPTADLATSISSLRSVVPSIGLPGCLPSCTYTPQDLWSLYDMPATDEGQGQTMAILGEGATSGVITDLRDFEQANGLPQVPVTVKDVGAGPFTDTSGSVEWDLDTQATTGMAPQASSETLYFASSLSDVDAETVISSWVSDADGPVQANASWGECETDPLNPVFNLPPFDQETNPSPVVGLGDDLELVAENTLEQAATDGRTLFTSAGDTGSSCPLLILPVIGAGNGILNQLVPFDNYPCASDFAVCVGGTVLWSDGGTPPQRAIEYSWPFSGGGSSAFIKEPPFQKDVPAIDHPCVVDNKGVSYPSGTLCRGAPDVAAMSGDAATNGYEIISGGSPSVEGGTSLSSPIWVGTWARVQADAASNLGFADPTIYAIGTGYVGDYARDFTDITLGTNGYYLAGTGWDYVSGWGVPNVANLVQDLDGTLTPKA